MSNDTSSEPIRVTHMINNMACGGIQRQMLELIKYLPPEYESHVLVFDDTCFFGDSAFDHAASSRFVSRSGAFFPARALAAARRYQGQNASVV